MYSSSAFQKTTLRSCHWSSSSLASNYQKNPVIPGLFRDSSVHPQPKHHDSASAHGQNSGDSSNSKYSWDGPLASSWSAGGWSFTSTQHHVGLWYLLILLSSYGCGFHSSRIVWNEYLEVLIQGWRRYDFVNSEVFLYYVVFEVWCSMRPPKITFRCSALRGYFSWYLSSELF